jgi:ABC-type antimicrobial peptide transport system permease subunit
MFLDIVRQLLATLWAHKLRSFLTMFGIAWGVGSLLLLVSSGATPVASRGKIHSHARPRAVRNSVRDAGWSRAIPNLDDTGHES